MESHDTLSPAPLVADPALAAELKQLGDKLTARQSIVAAAVGFALICVGIILFGIALKLYAESAKLPLFFWPIAAASLGCLVATTVSWVKARRMQLGERADYARYRELRAKAGLD